MTLRLRIHLESNKKETKKLSLYKCQNSVYSCGETLNGYSLETESDRKIYISKFKDSLERLKIMSILLAQQVKELEETGEILTKLYYPEETK